MSCATQALVRMTVSAGQLPEGYCPNTMQELADAITSRIIVTPNQNYSTFAVGSNEPSTNVGPWFKNCEEWWVYDDSTARYRPISKGGFDSVQVLDSSGTYTVPEGIFKIQVEGWGAGGGGAVSSGFGSGGGGGYGLKILTVTPGQSFSFVVGAGGAFGTPGLDGGDTTFDTMVCGGGKGGRSASNDGGAGGTVTGADMSISGGPGMAADASSAQGSIGGASPRGGPGGSTAFTTLTNRNGVVPGGGGCGQYSSSGNGANGRIVIWT